MLGRVLGLVSLTHRVGLRHGLLLVSPLFLVAAAPAVFGGAAIVVPAALAGARGQRRPAASPEP